MRQKGFTLVELVMVIMILGILAVYATSNIDSLNMDSYSGAEELVQAIRYAQQEAMDNTNTAGIGINISSHGFSFVGINSPVNTWQLSVPNGVQYNVNIVPNGGTITFDRRGVPTCGAPFTCTATPQTFTVTAGDSSATFTVEPFTGLAHR